LRSEEVDSGEVMKGIVKSINISGEKGVEKKPVSEVCLKKGLGIEGDAHAGPGKRQVSLLSGERIDDQKSALNPGDFAENITTEGIDWLNVNVGDVIHVGMSQLKVSQIGKECHSNCIIFERLGDCIMPREGIFAEVVEGGTIRPGDVIEVTHND